MSNLQLEDAFRSALIEIEQEKQQGVELTSSTRSAKQMRSYIENLEWNDKQLITFRDTLDQMIHDRSEKAQKAERLQTYRAKLINMARDLNMSYDELVTTMVDLESVKK
ncbi:hypothetical protein [Ferrimonas lipolytica]|uniref:Uncharacterized protein n=1 Tax=Ferrimonas lipolytica TaxID=2724191 RepID=A0A6H1UF57_9GAMM|nr:hypothetical protein [Ferrimonas lipolytica]QIZ76846.1 hypothetical protein HER31_08130 [Ferrimonas lipolytica]